MKIFNISRIGFDELYDDAVKFLKDKYAQSKQVFSISSPFGQLLTVFLSLGRMILFFVHNLITESNIYTAQRDDSIRGLAVLSGHNPTRPISAEGIMEVRYNGDAVEMYGSTLLLKRNLKLVNNDNKKLYFLSFNNKDYRMTLNPNTKFECKIMQGEIEAQSNTGTGKKMQSVSFTVDAGVEIEHFNIDVYVNGELWAIKESLYDLGYDEKACIVKTGLTSGIDVFFGNKFNGAIPKDGEKIHVEYIKSHGQSGNIRFDEETTFTFIDSGFDLMGAEIDLNNILELRMITDISFGADKEPIELTRLLAPKTSKSFVLANTDNYISLFEKFNMFSIIDAYTKFDDEDVTNDSTIYILLVPDINKRMKKNENYFTVPISAFTLSNAEEDKIYNLIERSGQKMTHAINKIVKPKISKYGINISLSIFESYQKETIQEEIIEILSDFFLNLSRRDKIPKSDLIALIESIDGVDSISLNFISEKNEIHKLNGLKGQSGLNEFGDIIIEKDEFVLIRGGWYDRYKRFLYDSLDHKENSIVNFSFSNDTAETMNARKHQSFLKKRKNINDTQMF